MYSTIMHVVQGLCVAWAVGPRPCAAACITMWNGAIMSLRSKQRLTKRHSGLPMANQCLQTRTMIWVGPGLPAHTGQTMGHFRYFNNLIPKSINTWWPKPISRYRESQPKLKLQLLMETLLVPLEMQMPNYEYINPFVFLTFSHQVSPFMRVTFEIFLSFNSVWFSTNKCIASFYSSRS